MIPVLLGAAAIFGAGKMIGAHSDNQEAKETNAQATRIANSARNKAVSANEKMNRTLDQLGRTETKLMRGNISDFVKMMSGIYDEFEYRRNKTGLEMLEEMGFQRKVVEEMKKLTTAMSKFNSNPQLGSGDEVTSGTKLGLMGVGSLLLGGVVGMAIYGIMRSNEAEAALYEARTRLDKANLFRERCEGLCAFFDAVSNRTNKVNRLVDNLNSYLTPALDNMRKIVSRNGYDFSRYSEEDQIGVFYAYQITQTIKNLIEAPIIQNDGTLNPMLDAPIDAAEQNLELLEES